MKRQHVSTPAEVSIAGTIPWQPMVYVAGPYTSGWRDNPLAVIRNIARAWEEVYRIVSACSARVTVYPPWWDQRLVELDAVNSDGYCRAMTCEDYQRAAMNALLRCDGAIFVLDWESSAGSLEEWEFCWRNGIPRFDASQADGAEIESFVLGLKARR